MQVELHPCPKSLAAGKKRITISVKLQYIKVELHHHLINYLRICIIIFHGKSCKVFHCRHFFYRYLFMLGSSKQVSTSKNISQLKQNVTSVSLYC